MHLTRYPLKKLALCALAFAACGINPSAQAAGWTRVENVTAVRVLAAEASNLRDPFRAQYRNLHYKVMVDPADGSKVRFWCGEVNASAQPRQPSGWARFAAADGLGGQTRFYVIPEEGELRQLTTLFVDNVCRGTRISTQA